VTATPRTLAERKATTGPRRAVVGGAAGFAFRGFEETTIDQIAAAAGVSRRTFFRYFKTKEDVIIEFLSEVGHLVPAALAARPAEETPLVALRQAFAAVLDPYVEHPEKSLRLPSSSWAPRRCVPATWTTNTMAGRADRRVRTAHRPRPGHRPASCRHGRHRAGRVRAAIHRWIRGDGSDELHDLADQAFTLAGLALS